MASHTERELILWLAYFDALLDRPDRTDSYLMQIACEVRRVLSKKPGEIKLKDFRLRFETVKKEKPMYEPDANRDSEETTENLEMSQRESLRDEERKAHQKLIGDVSKAKWMNVVGPDIEIREIPKSSLLPEDQWEVQP